MDWTYKCKRILGGRFGLSAILFLLVLTVGAFSVLLGVVDGKTACPGYALPTTPVKRDPTRPQAQAPAPPSLAPERLDAPAPVESWDARLSQKTAAAEAAVQSVVSNHHGLIHLYGGFQTLTGRTVVEDAVEPVYSVVRLDNGQLTFAAEAPSSAASQAAFMKRLQHALDDRDIPLLYVQAPSKVEDSGALPYGVADSSNENADIFLAALEEKGIDCLDLREVLRGAGGGWDDWFYTTDHHWNQEAAFTAFQAVCDKLEDYDQRFTVSRGAKTKPIVLDQRWQQRESYRISRLSGVFLGSQGKRVGSLYAGMDDFDLWVPDSPTLLRYGSTVPADHGDAEDTVLFPKRLEESDPFAGSLYTYYAGGDYGFVRATNYYNPSGPRVMLVRDSYACAITPYLAYSCSDLSIIDPRYFNDNFLTYVNWIKPDVVIVLYSPGSLRNPAQFSFLAQPAAPSKGDVLRWLED